MLKRFLLFALMFFVKANVSSAQSTIPVLSLKHIQKVEEVQSAKDKLKYYKKYYSKDSLKQAKQVEKYWQSKIDSLNDMVSEREDAIKQKSNKLTKRAERRYNNLKQRFNYQEVMVADTLKLRAQDSLLIKGGDLVKGNMDIQASGLDKANNLRGNTFEKGNEVIKKEEAGELGKLTGDVKSYQEDVLKYNGQLKSYLASDSVLKQDAKVKAMEEIQKRASGVKEYGLLQEHAKLTNEWRSKQNEYAQHADQLNDSTYRKEQAKKKAEELAMDYINDNPAVLKSAQSKMDLLMKRYSVVPNSNDLSSAVKRTSLQGKSFKERLYVAGNFQVLSIKPVSIDFSPMVGYRFNTRLIGGIGGTMRKTFGDSLARVSSNVLGYKTFMSYDVFLNFFAYSEFANNSPGFKQSDDSQERIWESAFFIGVGRKFPVHQKVQMTMVVLYNLTREQDDSVYTGKWMVRFGFQLSEVAMLKRKVYE